MSDPQAFHAFEKAKMICLNFQLCSNIFKYSYSIFAHPWVTYGDRSDITAWYQRTNRLTQKALVENRRTSNNYIHDSTEPICTGHKTASVAPSTCLEPHYCLTGVSKEGWYLISLIIRSNSIIWNSSFRKQMAAQFRKRFTGLIYFNCSGLKKNAVQEFTFCNLLI